MTLHRILVTDVKLTHGFSKYTLEYAGHTTIAQRPLHDGARWLLSLGIDPSEEMTTRWAGKPYDSWNPYPIGEAAKWTIREGTRGLSRVRWKPYEPL